MNTLSAAAAIPPTTYQTVLLLESRDGVGLFGGGVQGNDGHADCADALCTLSVNASTSAKNARKNVAGVICDRPPKRGFPGSASRHRHPESRLAKPSGKTVLAAWQPPRGQQVWPECYLLPVT
jgi:hypothetical protein